jgi:cell division protein FtsB
MTAYKKLYETERQKNAALQEKLLWALDQLQRSGQPVGNSQEEAALAALHARNTKIRHRAA